MTFTKEICKRLCLISYDLEHDRTRTRLAHRLKDFGKRVQYSVFEADITDAELEKLHQVLKKVELKKEDSIRVYIICEACLKKITIYGTGEITQDKDLYIA